jgi:hypothetical protein
VACAFMTTSIIFPWDDSCGDSGFGCPVERNSTLSPRLQEEPHLKSTVAHAYPANGAGRERNLFVCFRTARGEPI